MEKINKILNSSLAKKGLLKQAKGAEICFYAEKWKDIPLSPISFADGVLKVFVQSSSAAAELHMKEEKLINFINKKAGRKIVRRLKILNRN